MESWILSIVAQLSIVFSDDIGVIGGEIDGNSFYFEYPFWLWLILLWPLIWFITSWLSQSVTAQDDLDERQNNQHLRVKHALIHRMHAVKLSSSRMGWSLPMVFLNLLRGLVIVALAIALAKPMQQLPTQVQPDSKTVRDIVFVIESSASFLLPDYQIDGQPESRMNVVKHVLDQFVGQLEGNRFSLAIYADKAFTLLPLTYDQTVTRLTLKRLKPYLAGRTDVAMGEALGLALKQTDSSQNSNHKNTQDGFQKAEQRKKIVVLISDGLSLPSRLELTEAVNYAQLLKVPIYTIGVGSSSKQADKRLYSGLLYQPLESESLRMIAEQTNGVYYQVGSGQEISQVLEQINQAEGVPYIPPPAPPQKKDLYPIPLTLALSTFLLYWLVSLIWTGRARRV